MRVYCAAKINPIYLKKMKIKLSQLLFGFLFFSVQIAVAQEKQISGIVTDASQLSLPGVSVVVKNTNQGTQTDLDGKFTLKASPDAILVVTFMGFKTQEIKVSHQPSVVIRLEEETIGLDEIVIVAYGTQKQRAVVGAIGKVGSEVFEKQQATSVLSALQGSVPGVSVINSSGQPGESPTIRVRGIGSINASSSPLIIVDGVPFNGNINSISSDQIESMNVLKDAASTALYGSRGANGVIVIKTKSGRKNTAPQVSFRVSSGVASDAVKTHEVLGSNDYVSYLWQARKNTYQYVQGQTPENAATNATTGMVSAMGYNPYNTSNFINNSGQLNPDAQLIWDTNWKEELFRNQAFRNEYNSNISGGSDNTSYFLSANYLNQEGLVKTSKFERATVRLNIDTKVNDWLDVGTNVAYSASNQNFPVQSGTQFTSAMNWLYATPSIYPVYRRDQNGTIITNNGAPIYDYGNNTQLVNGVRPLMSGDNAVGSLYNDKKGNTRSNINLNGYAKFQLAEKLSFKTNLAFEDYSFDSNAYTNSVYGQASSVNGRVSREKTVTQTLNFINALRYDTSFGDHNLGVDVIYEAYQSKNDLFSASATGFLPGVTVIGGGTTPESVGGYVVEDRLNSILRRVSYDFKNKYFLEASYRRDGSSRFSKKVRWGDFYAVGASWIISDENFLKNSNVLSLLKLRSSYGELGNNQTTSFFPYIQSFETGHSQLGNPGVLLGDRVDENLTWEKTGSFNIGLDFSLFNNRIEGTIDYYNKSSIDLLYNVPTPSSTGNTSILTNAGSLRNYGLEVSLTSHNIKREKFSWNTQLNFSLDRNKITKLTQESFITGLNQWQVGRSLYDFYIRDYAGVDPNDGYAMWYKDIVDANGTVTGKETTKNYDEATRYYQHSALPKITGGITNTFQLYRFDLNVLFNFSVGAYVYDSDYASLMGGISRGRQSSPDIANSWTQPGDSTDVPVLLNSTNNFAATSSRFLYKNDYVRLKALTFGYSLPIDSIRKLKISQARLYLQGDNLLTFQSHKGIDPEQSIDGTTNFRAPLQRTITLGFNLNF
ncbi:SusC/RagA family TonB-linked outer membrane protein [Flavobacterium kingsejongi]|uniref:SusC/RagA family TonB-linked outer membrane protein n=2 Tax=Flavobacterium kingsejongi TaxID=1678728 RepID=A0A2S1LPW1_9FLAO|nr:SusC/RagA family TonB-linked outer membrane protein [Flavobacterium kingsejongi]